MRTPSPFVTAAQDKAGVVPGPIVSVPAAIDPVKLEREQMEYHATELIRLFNPRIQQIVTETIDYHPSYKNKDVIYKALELLGEQKLNKR